MKAVLPIGLLLVTLTVAAAAMAAWASVADAPWEGTESNTGLLCQDALERRQAVEEALQRPVTLPSGLQGPLSAMRKIETFRGEIERLESDLGAVNRDIQNLCK